MGYDNKKPSKYKNVTGLWATQSGGFKSAKISQEMVEILKNAEVGGKLFIFNNDKEDKNEKSPQAYLKYMSAADVEASANYTKTNTASTNVSTEAPF